MLEYETAEAPRAAMRPTLARPDKLRSVIESSRALAALMKAAPGLVKATNKNASGPLVDLRAAARDAGMTGCGLAGGRAMPDEIIAKGEAMLSGPSPRQAVMTGVQFGRRGLDARRGRAG